MNEIEKLLEANEGRSKLQLDWGAAGLVASLTVRSEGAHTPVYYRGEGATVDAALSALEADIVALTDKPKDIYSLARQVVEGNGGWSAGQTREVWKSGKSRVTIHEHGRDGGGLLTLTISNGEKVSRQCGHLDVIDAGWVWTLSRSAYEAMVAEFKKKVGGS